MSEERPESREPREEPKEDTRTAWQRNKEELYDKVPLSAKQLDVIIVLGWIGLAVVAVLIALEAAGIM